MIKQGLSKKRIHQENINIYGVTGADLKVLGYQTIDVIIGANEYKLKFYVLEALEMPFDGLIGRDILGSLGTLVDSENCCLVMNNEVITLGASD